MEAPTNGNLYLKHLMTYLRRASLTRFKILQLLQAGLINPSMHNKV